jgi:long-chain fatty acid transport protein
MKVLNNLKIPLLISLSVIPLFAINGDLLIGFGAKSRAMGGLGIAKSHGAESALVNPAMLSSVEGTEISVTTTFFHPVAYYNGGAGEEYSTSDLTLIPELSFAKKVNDNFYWGAGIWVVGGLGADYSKSGNAVTGGNGTFQMRTILGLVKFGIPLVYKKSGLSIGFTPILQYGELDINYLLPDGAGGLNNIADGSSKDFGLGYNFGLSYDFSQQGIDDLTVGLVYKSPIKMNYKGQISAATQPFATALGGVISDDLEQPAEIGFGLSYQFLENHTLAFDYKYIPWEDAKGYKDFGWKNQNVYILGYEYKQKEWALRAGYNYAKSPLRELEGTTAKGAALNLFNLLGFPVNIESHYSVGGSYSLNDNLSADVAFVYADEQSNTYNTSALVAQGIASEVSVRHKQISTSLQLTYTY